MAEEDRTRWDERYRATEVRVDPAPFLLSLDDLLPGPRAPGDRPRALDVAGGAGRNAIWLARRGLDVTIADISPVALDLARAAAAAVGVTLRLIEVDLETAPLPAGPFDLIVAIDFIHRPLFSVFPATLAPAGLLVASQPTRRNLERHSHPSARFLLQEGELRALVRDLEVLRYEEGWFDDRHEARIVARRRDSRDR